MNLGGKFQLTLSFPESAEGDDIRSTLLVRHRLTAAGNIDDAQPVEAKADISAVEETEVVGPTVSRHPPHADQQIVFYLPVWIEIEKAVDATHRSALLA